MFTVTNGTLCNILGMRFPKVIHERERFILYAIVAEIPTQSLVTKKKNSPYLAMHSAAGSILILSFKVCRFLFYNHSTTHTFF